MKAQKSAPITVDQAALPAPLVPAEVDLRDFVFMPLDVVRLRDSDLSCIENAEVFRCAVMSWCVSWHQIPAASLPDDDTLLARLFGFGRDMRGWKRLRAAGGLRGWVRCSDGRLYHPVVAEKAHTSWERKQEQRARTATATATRIAKRKAEQEASDPTRDVERDVRRHVERDVHQGIVKGQGEGQGQGERKLFAGSLPTHASVAADNLARAHGEVQDDPPEAGGQQPTQAGLVCRSMRKLGVLDVNPGDPRLLALLQQGATTEEFAGVAADAARKGKGFAWALVALVNRRQEAAAITLPGMPGKPAKSRFQAEREAEVLAWVGTASLPGMGTNVIDAEEVSDGTPPALR